MSQEPSVLITGAGSGIGRATAEKFLGHGWYVLLVGRRPEPLNEIVRKHPHKARAFSCDLKDAKQVTDLADKILSDSDFSGPKKLSALVNNAAYYERTPFLESDDTHWQKHFEVNVLAPVRLTRFLAPLLIKNGGGSIVNISSTLGLRPVNETSAYAASKAALVNLTQSLAIEFARHRIRVNCVCPGIVDTPIHPFHKADTPELAAIRKTVDQMHPLGRMGRSEEVAHAIHYFCMPESEWTTGAVLTVDGGINLV